MQSWLGELEQLVKNCHNFHMLNSIELLVRGETYLVTMATSTWTLPINCATMDILSWHVYKGIHYHHNQNDPCIGLLYSTFLLTTITFCHVSPHAMAVPNLFLQDLKKRTKTTFRKKLRKIKMFVFEIAKVKVQ